MANRAPRARPLVTGLAALLMTTAVSAAPPIRITAANRVPVCVTPERLMAFVKTRNETLDPRYRDIARWYKYWGERFAVRWDYAFYQMAIETNYLKYRRGDGHRGDVHEKQNNFAGIGATGGGVAGDRFPDIKTGVQAQFQHLVAYSGEHVDDPVARRTRENQDEIIAKSKRLNRAVTFGDLARRWAADRQYAKSIDFVADQFRTTHCNSAVSDNLTSNVIPVANVAPRTEFAKPSRLGGPEPERLAGPVGDLPWTEAQAPSPETPQPQSGAAEPVEPQQKKKPPVRTIWSRDGKIDPPTPGAKNKASIEPPPRPAKPAKIESAAPEAPPVAAVTAPIAPQPVPPVAPAQPPATALPPTAEAKDDLPVLPTFRIAPREPEPSHLGGPLPQLLKPPTPVASGTPRVHFKEVIDEADARATVTPPTRSTAALTTASPAAPTHPCHVVTASYGGTKTLLVRTSLATETRLTALTVLEGFEKSMFENFAKANGGGDIIGEYASKDAALSDARANCASE